MNEEDNLKFLGLVALGAAAFYGLGLLAGYIALVYYQMSLVP